MGLRWLLWGSYEAEVAVMGPEEYLEHREGGKWGSGPIEAVGLGVGGVGWGELGGSCGALWVLTWGSVCPQLRCTGSRRCTKWRSPLGGPPRPRSPRR